MTRILLAMFVAAFLSGCGAGGGRPATEYKVVEKIVEVQKPCPVERPARPRPIGVLPVDLFALAATLGAKLKEYAAPGGYADKADAAIGTCQQGGAH